MPRPFASGSRQAPDPYDQYLEKNGFYRKHIARDSSCLFRTISEQMYDTQLHHLVIRERCVNFMRKHKNVFEKDVDRDIDEYLDEMSKPKTYGTLLELRAMAYMYRRNVALFEAYNTGTYMVEEYDFKNVFRVFFTPEKHFDSVFTENFIETAAFCQGVCYEILYRYVFKLPDVMYAVEQMLHGNTLEFIKSKMHYSGPYAKEIVFADGRKFALNTPEDTDCILENRILCHFHNPNFPQFADNLHHDMHLIEVAQCDNQKITKTLDSLLPEKYISCVQQLLKDGITPFPYKVAKALDPDIYRNIEFDAWSEVRKEQRFKNWYTGGNNLQVGVKCLVKLGASQNNIYNCHIQEMATEKGGPCLVYVEELAQKRMVPYEALQPLPSELAKPWPLPFRFQRHMERFPGKNDVDDVKKSRGLNGKRRYRGFISTIKKEIYTNDDNKEDVSYQLKQFTTIQHFYPPSYEVLAMPFNVEHCGNENPRSSRRGSVNSAISHATNNTDVIKHESKKEDENDLDCAPDDAYPFSYDSYSDAYYPYPYDGNGMPSGPHNPLYCMYNGQPYQPPPQPSNGIVSHGVYMQPAVHCSQPMPGGYYQNSLAPLMPHPPISGSGIASSITSTMSSSNFCRQQASILSAVTGRVNLSATKSLLASGEDLPTDIPTLRFFYNLGYEYYKLMQRNSGESSVDNDKTDQTSKLASILENNMKLDKENTNPNQMKTEVNNNYNSGQYNGKRFSSRYFNSKRNEKGGYRGGNLYRSSNPDSYGKSTMPNKNSVQSSTVATKNHNNYTNAKPSSTSNNNNNNHHNAVASSSVEQAIQTSPLTTLTSPDAWNTDFSQTPAMFSAQAGPMQYGGTCIPVFPENGESQHGVYVQQPAIMTVPYGMYPVPQPAPPPPPHPGPTFQAYLSAPPNATAIQMPSFAPNPFLSAGNSGGDMPSIVVNSDPVENGSYTFMSYSPVYYSPTNGSNAISANGTPMQPGYWYQTAPTQTISSNIPTTTVMSSSTPTTNVSIPSR